MNFAEAIEDWTGWCPKKQKMLVASRTNYQLEESSIKTQKIMGSRTIKGIAAIVLISIAVLAGMRLEFNSMQSIDWFMRDPKALEGYQWLANNTESDATVLAWWDYADGIEKIGNRRAVIEEASMDIQDTIAGYADSGKPWHKIEYALWYPYESDEKVRDVASFFLSENATSAKEIARKYGANYVLVMSEDMGRYYTVIMASGDKFRDYVMLPANHSTRISDIRPYLRKETIFTRMVSGNQVDGFEKAFDNGWVRIYRMLPQ